MLNMTRWAIPVRRTNLAFSRKENLETCIWKIKLARLKATLLDGVTLVQRQTTRTQNEVFRIMLLFSNSITFL